MIFKRAQKFSKNWTLSEEYLLPSTLKNLFILLRRIPPIIAYERMFTGQKTTYLEIT